MTSKPNEKAMVPAQPGPVAAPQQTGRLVPQIDIEDAERQLGEIVKGQKLLAELVDYALKATDGSDWDDMGAKRKRNPQTGKWETIPYSGTPRLNAKGAKKVAGVARVEVYTHGTVLVEEERDEESRLKYFCYECQGTVTSPWRLPMSCQGSADSDNQFHSTRYEWNNETREQERKKLPAYKVNRVNIRQQAQTNCVTRGVTQYLTLEKLTWDEVKKYTSVDPNAAPRTAATFGTGKPETQQPPLPQPPPPQAPPKTAAEPPKYDAEKIGALKRAAAAAEICTDLKGWWAFVSDKLGAEKSLGVGGTTEDEVYAAWTDEDIAEIEKAVEAPKQ